MFLHSENYNNAIKTVIKDAKSIDIAVAFWGKGAEALIPEGKRIRIICNLGSGATNPDVIARLLSCKGVEVRDLDSLHAKVVLTKERAIVGSANFSTNGLNFEGHEELQGWHEAGLVTDNQEHLDDMQSWFNDRWQESLEITDSLLKAAKEVWNSRFNTRPYDLRKGKRLLDIPEASLAGRNIVVAVYRTRLSEMAKEKLQQKKDEAQDPVLTKGWECYEDWDELEIGNIVIDVYIGPKEGVHINGPYEIFDRVDYAIQDKEEGEIDMILHYARKLKSFPSLPMPVIEALAGIKEQIARDPERLLSKDAEESRLIPLEKFIPEIAAF